MRSQSLILAAWTLSAGGCAVGTHARRPGDTAPPILAEPTDPYPAIPTGETTLRRADGSIEAIYHYRLIEPPKPAISDPGSRVPLIVFLHGSGERGSDNCAQLKHFAGWCATDALQEKHPCYVLAMQCPAGESWSPIDIKDMRERGELPKFAPEPTRAMRALMQAIEQVRQAKPVDPTRIYLTGLSMGGFGSFDLAARRPSLFAAVVPICGGGDPATAPIVSVTPFYIVHGSDDPVVPVAFSRSMREAIAAEAVDARETGDARGRTTIGLPHPTAIQRVVPLYREYDGVGHDSWTPAYRLGDDGVLEWMFEQQRTEIDGAKYS